MKLGNLQVELEENLQVELDSVDRSAIWLSILRSHYFLSLLSLSLSSFFHFSFPAAKVKTRTEFEKFRGLTDPVKIEEARTLALLIPLQFLSIPLQFFWSCHLLD